MTLALLLKCLGVAAYTLAEYWLGITKTTKSNSVLELVLTVIAGILKAIFNSKSGDTHEH